MLRTYTSVLDDHSVWIESGLRQKLKSRYAYDIAWRGTVKLD
jgi:hypothetical protein